MIRKLLCVSIIPFVPLNFLRIWGYRLVGFHIGKKVFIGMQCYMDDYCPERTTIEDHVTISYRVTFASHGPSVDGKSILIKHGSYIGTNATILGGSTIGPCATVGACALVNKIVPPFSLAIGVPCQIRQTNCMPWSKTPHDFHELAAKYAPELLADASSQADSSANATKAV